jgi:hypothetical protein
VAALLLVELSQVESGPAKWAGGMWAKIVSVEGSPPAA